MFQFIFDEKGEFTILIELEMIEQGIAPNMEALKDVWQQKLAETIEEATLSFPLSNEKGWFQSGGKKGIHTEYLGFILADLQYMQKTYPNSEW